MLPRKTLSDLTDLRKVLLEKMLGNRQEGKRKIHSLNREITGIFICIMALTVSACILVNSLFLEKVYTREKQDEIFSVFNKLNDYGDNVDSHAEELETLCGTHNISFALLSSIYAPVKIISYEPEELLIRELKRFLVDGGVRGENIVNTDEYAIFKIKDEARNTDYIEMIGVLNSGSFVLLRTPLESIRVSAGIANRFLLYIGLGGMIISAVVIFLFTRKISKPILSLAEISERVSEMDFEARYTGKDKTEIAVLGQSINKMSDNLKKAFDELKNANAELKKDNELKTEIDNMRKEFISNVSHELKTPIALIQGYAEGLKEGISDEAERDYYCDVIMDEAMKMNDMVKKLLNLNQLEWGDDVLSKENFDVCELVKNITASFDIITSQNGIEVNVCGLKQALVCADEFKIEEVFKNYFSNALNHVKSDTKKRIDVAIEKAENEIKVSVFNTGDRIPEESLPHLFEKFYKVDKARTREYGGSGVGLSIVKAIMEAHQKEYGVYNTDEGVCFWFVLDSADTEET